MKIQDLEGYILSKELVAKAGFASANISMAIQNMVEGDDYIKYGNLIFLNTESKFPKNFLKHFCKCKKLDGLLPYNFFRDSVLKPENFKGKFNIITIENEKFVEIIDARLRECFSNITYILDKNETNEAINNDYIDGYFQINKNNYLVWY